MKARPGFPVVVLGLGKAGGSLALGLKRQRWNVSALTRSSAAARRAVAWDVPLAGPDELQAAQVVLVAVPDDAVAEVAGMLHRELPRRAALVHLSGALSLGALPAARPRGSLHPLVALWEARASLAGHHAALAASTPTLRTRLRALAQALGLHTFAVDDTRRAAYHAGAVLSAGLAVALADTARRAVESAGVAPPLAQAALLPLLRSALEGLEARGPSRGLTGPIVRGDVGVVRAHLASLPNELREVYRALSRRALALAPALPPPTRAALSALLS